jgi:hypothetical protein
MNAGTMSVKSIRKCTGSMARFWRLSRPVEDFRIRFVPTYSFIIRTGNDLPSGNTTIVVVVRFGFAPDDSENNFVMTAYQIFRPKQVNPDETRSYHI